MPSSNNYLPPFVFCCLFAARLRMSDYDTDPLEHFNQSGELLLEAAQSPSVQCRSVRITSSQSQYQIPASQMRTQASIPGPGLQLSQLQELASLIVAS